MKKNSFLWLALSLLLLALPAVQTSALDEEVEIELMEISGFLPGDDPLDGVNDDGTTPPQPNNFSATITGRTLAVTSGTYSGRLIVRNSAGTQVLDRQFSGGTVEQLSTSGSYSLEIQSGSLTLVGQFSAQ